MISYQCVDTNHVIAGTLHRFLGPKGFSGVLMPRVWFHQISNRQSQRPSAFYIPGAVSRKDGGEDTVAREVRLAHLPTLEGICHS